MPPQWRADTRVEGQLVGLLDPGIAPNGEETQEGGLAREEGRMSPGSVGPGTSQSAELGGSQGSELGDSQGTGLPNLLEAS